MASLAKSWTREFEYHIKSGNEEHQRIARESGLSLSSGTAFSVAPEVLITNRHVVKGCSSVDVISSDGRRTGSIGPADADIDLAILRVSGLRGTTARLRDPTNVLLGEPILVFGYPYAGDLSSSGNFTSGVVSALRGLRDSANEIQITSPIQLGNSGGPLMDSSGLVIGVVQSKLSLNAVRVLRDIPQNVNFAISLEALTRFLAKHKVAFRSTTRSPPLDTASVAEMAQKFTHRIECNVSEQRAGNSARPNGSVSPRPSQQRATCSQARSVCGEQPVCQRRYEVCMETSCWTVGLAKRCGYQME